MILKKEQTTDKKHSHSYACYFSEVQSEGGEKRKMFVLMYENVGRHLWELSSSTGRVWRQWGRYRTLRHYSSIRSNDRIKAALLDICVSHLVSFLSLSLPLSSREKWISERKSEEDDEEKNSLYMPGISVLIICWFNAYPSERTLSLHEENSRSAIFYINNPIILDTCYESDWWKRNTLTGANYVCTIYMNSLKRISGHRQAIVDLLWLVFPFYESSRKVRTLAWEAFHLVFESLKETSTKSTMVQNVSSKYYDGNLIPSLSSCDWKTENFFSSSVAPSPIWTRDCLSSAKRQGKERRRERETTSIAPLKREKLFFAFFLTCPISSLIFLLYCVPANIRFIYSQLITYDHVDKYMSYDCFDTSIGPYLETSASACAAPEITQWICDDFWMSNQDNLTSTCCFLRYPDVKMSNDQLVVSNLVCSTTVWLSFRRSTDASGHPIRYRVGRSTDHCSMRGA